MFLYVYSDIFSNLSYADGSNYLLDKYSYENLWIRSYGNIIILLEIKLNRIVLESFCPGYTTVKQFAIFHTNSPLNEWHLQITENWSMIRDSPLKKLIKSTKSSILWICAYSDLITTYIECLHPHWDTDKMLSDLQLSAAEPLSDLAVSYCWKRVVMLKEKSRCCSLTRALMRR